MLSSYYFYESADQRSGAWGLARSCYERIDIIALLFERIAIIIEHNLGFSLADFGVELH
jgi:hypothetical protein